MGSTGSAQFMFDVPLNMGPMEHVFFSSFFVLFVFVVIVDFFVLRK